MKKFSSLDKEVKPKYELKDSLRNEIYSLIDETISLKISNEKSLDKDIDIHGKDELVEKFKKLIDDVRIKERTQTLETVKANSHRNFDMKWLNEQLENLKKTKIGSNFILKEAIQDQNAASDEYKAEILNYFVKKLNEVKKIGSFEFDYEPSEGIFKFYSEDDGILVKATPFYNDKSGLPIEVFEDDDVDNHIFIEQRHFNIEEILFNKYLDILQNFLVDSYDSLIKKVEKAEEPETKDIHYQDFTKF